jgi:hypothetical protein
MGKSEGQETAAAGVKRRSKVPRRNNFVVVMTTEVLKYDSAKKIAGKRHIAVRKGA